MKNQKALIGGREMKDLKLDKKDRNLTGWVDFSYQPSADQLARIFWAMDEEEQAHFFNYIGDMEGFAQQMHAAFSNDKIDTSGRWAASVIGGYGNYQ